MQVVILAGGLGTRLRPLTLEKPKSMIEIEGKPFLQYQIELLRRQGVEDIVLCIGYLGEKIEEYFGDGRKFGVRIKYSREEKPLGTAGALKKAENLLEDPFFTLYGDSYLFADLKAIYAWFMERTKLALMTVYKNYDRYDRSNTVIEGEFVKKYDKRNKTSDMIYIEYGLNLFRKKVLDLIPDKPYGLEDLFPRLAEMKELLAYEVFERFYEIGSPKGLYEFTEFVRRDR